MIDNEYRFKTTSLIAEAFSNEYHIPFETTSTEKEEVVSVYLHALCQEDAELMFKSCDNGNSLSCSICLIKGTPADRKNRILEAFNCIHNIAKYKMRLSLNPEGAIYMRYEFLTSCLNKSLGSIAYELWARINADIDTIIQFLNLAINSDMELDSSSLVGEPIEIAFPKKMSSEFRLECETIIDELQQYRIMIFGNEENEEPEVPDFFSIDFDSENTSMDHSSEFKRATTIKEIRSGKELVFLNTEKELEAMCREDFLEYWNNNDLIDAKNDDSSK